MTFYSSSESFFFDAVASSTVPVVHIVPLTQFDVFQYLDAHPEDAWKYLESRPSLLKLIASTLQDQNGRGADTQNSVFAGGQSDFELFGTMPAPNRPARKITKLVITNSSNIDRVNRPENNGNQSSKSAQISGDTSLSRRIPSGNLAKPRSKVSIPFCPPTATKYPPNSPQPRNLSVSPSPPSPPLAPPSEPSSDDTWHPRSQSVESDQPSAADPLTPPAEEMADPKEAHSACSFSPNGESSAERSTGECDDSYAMIPYPAPVELVLASYMQKKGKLWRLFEEESCIRHMLAIRDEGVLKGEARFLEAQRRMKDINGVDKPAANAVKNFWNRTGRARSGYDERKNKRAPLSTSQQGKHARANRTASFSSSTAQDTRRQSVDTSHAVKPIVRKRKHEGDGSDDEYRP